MTNYEVRRFNDELELPDGAEVVAANLSAQGTRTSSSTASNLALVRIPDDEYDEAVSQGVAEPRCGYDGCQRQVSDPDERCWQHEDEG